MKHSGAKRIAIFLAMAAFITGSLAACNNASDNSSTPADNTSTSAEASAESSEETEEPSASDVESSEEASADASEESAESSQESKIDEQMVKNKINEFMTALKTGDVNTLKTLTKDEFYDELSYPEEYKKIVAAIYGNMVWSMDFIPGFQLKDINDSKPFDIMIDVGSRRFMYYDEYDALRFKKGDVIPDGFQYESDEKAWEAFQATLEKMPLIYQRWIFRIIPDENGGMTIETDYSDYNYVTKNNYELSHVKNPGETLIELLKEVGVDYCVISPDVEIACNGEEGGGVGLRQETVELMKQKKYREAYELLLSKSDKIDPGTKYEYDDLSDEQKKYIQNTLDDSNAYAVEKQQGTSKYKDVTILLDCPVTDFSIEEERMNWIKENKLRDISVQYCTTYISVADFYDQCFDFYYGLVSDVAMID